MKTQQNIHPTPGSLPPIAPHNKERTPPIPPLAKGGLRTAASRALWVLLVSCFLLPVGLWAQTPLSLADALGTALKQNGGLVAAQQQVLSTQVLERTAITLDATQFQYQGGGISAKKYDHMVTVQQTVAWPGLYTAQGKYLEAQTAAAATLPQDVRNELGYAVQATYLRLCFLLVRQRLAQNQADLMASLATAEAAKYKAGAINQVTAAAATLRQQQLQTEATALDLDIAAAQRQLGLLLGTPDGGPYLPDTAAFYAVAPAPAAVLTDAAPDVSQNTLLLQQNRQLDALRAAVGVEVAKLRPSFSAGYFFQTIEQVSPFQGFMVGVNVPLWMRPQRARIESAQLAVTAATTQLGYQQQAVQTQAAAQQDELLKQRQRLDFYLQTGLPQAQLVLKAATTAYQAGELDLTAYLLLVNDAQATRVAYLDALLAYHNARLGLSRILGTAANLD